MHAHPHPERNKMEKKSILVLIASILFLLITVVPGMGRELELKFAITSAVGSDPSFSNYKELTEYIAKKAGRKSVFISGFTYNQVDNLFQKGQVDIGFLCNTHYARRSKAVGFEPIAAPVVTGYGKTKFQIYIIVNKDSGITSLEGLRGKTVDFSDPLSTTTIYGANMLLKMNETIKSYFGKAIYSGSHDMTIELVANGLADAGFIDGHIWDYHDKVSPDYSKKTKVIHRSSDFTIPPVVVSKTTGKALRAEIKRILFTMHEDAEGSDILKKLRIDKFKDVKGADYQDVLQMYEKVKDRI
ncbi:MAG: phosphate/phosphite/phosphonate ABC transporter substrate-binding protein [Nitrospiraceae bacterium]|nr:MAG: phosphate/phosphite/phosphonate ABC transporter substrate-binding protein [Nitrospiraceae bacterium]